MTCQLMYMDTGICTETLMHIDDIINGVVNIKSKPSNINEEYKNLNNTTLSSAPWSIINNPVKLSYFIEVIEKNLNKSKKNI